MERLAPLALATIPRLKTAKLLKKKICALNADVMACRLPIMEQNVTGFWTALAAKCSFSSQTVSLVMRLKGFARLRSYSNEHSHGQSECLLVSLSLTK